MRVYLLEYIKLVEKEIKKKSLNKNTLKENIKTKISFFQHEREIHLIITLFYALMFLIFLVLISLSLLFIIPALIILVFLICYIIHYFKLENGIQYLYKLYDKIDNLTKEDKK